MRPVMLVAAATVLAATAALVPPPQGAAAVDASTTAAFALSPAHRAAPVPVIGATASSAHVVAAAPTGPATAELDLRTQEQYWFWAYGVQITGKGFAAGERVTISDVDPKGRRTAWAPITADGNGTLTTRQRWYDVDPENTRPVIGVHQILLTGSAGANAAATLAITANADEKLPVKVSTKSVSQDAFMTSPVTITARGLRPGQRVLMNIGLPDSSTIGIGDADTLRASSTGSFRYVFRASTANQPTGTWSVYVQGQASDTYGVTNFAVSPGHRRVANKTLSMAPSIAASRFADTKGGLPFSAGHFKAFDAFETTLRTPRGAAVPLGILRTNGNGVVADRIRGFDGAPSGRYQVTIRSITSGDYAVRSFEVLGGSPIATPTVTATPARVTSAALAQTGTTLRGTGYPPQTTVFLAIRDADRQRMPLLTGTDLTVQTDDSGAFSTDVVSLRPVHVGTWNITASVGDPMAPGSFIARSTLTVTAR